MALLCPGLTHPETCRQSYICCLKRDTGPLAFPPEGEVSHRKDRERRSGVVLPGEGKRGAVVGEPSSCSANQQDSRRQAFSWAAGSRIGSIGGPARSQASAPDMATVSPFSLKHGSG